MWKAPTNNLVVTYLWWWHCCLPNSLGCHKIYSQGQLIAVGRLEHSARHSMWYEEGHGPDFHSGRCDLKIHWERKYPPGQFQQLDKVWGAESLFQLFARLAVLRVDSLPALPCRYLSELHVIKGKKKRRDYSSREGLGTKLSIPKPKSNFFIYQV